MQLRKSHSFICTLDLCLSGCSTHRIVPSSFDTICTLLSRAFMDQFKDSHYFLWANQHYRQLRQSYFFKNREERHEATLLKIDDLILNYPTHAKLYEIKGA